MKKIFFLSLLLLPFLSQAQFKNLINKAKIKVDQRADNKVDEAMDKVLDGIEGKQQKAEPADKSTAKTTTPAVEPVQAPALQSYSKYDFVPGEKVIYAEDFMQDEIGELPMNWNTAGKAELVTMNAVEGRWLRLYQNAIYLTSNKEAFTKNFTVEFDLILQLKNTGYSYPYFSFGFFSSNGEAPNGNAFLNEYTRNSAAEVFFRLSENNSTSTYLESSEDRKRYFLSDYQQLSTLEKSYNKVAHISMQVQEKRLRVWINGEKKFDVPMALSANYIFNQLFFKVTSSNYKEDEIGFYVGNLKVATGKPDTRHKLMDEGKFSTTGILFDSQSAAIKPESAGVLKEIANVLKENPTVKIRITGHTSSDGDDAANLELSKQRAQAVKDYLAKEHSIDAARLMTEGKGETQPVADNKTKEGKAQNRRVEFTKL